MSLPTLIRKILDFFYPVFMRFIPRETYYYAACGGGNLVLSWVLFFLFYQLVFQKAVLHIQFFNDYQFAFSAYTLSAACCFIITFIIGFLLMKYVVFVDSALKGRIQLFRYGLSSLMSTLLSWVLLKFFIEIVLIYPSISNVLSSLIVVVFSYLMQRNFTFR
jgi:putative flippase GtrA